jgi:hypothetical protein
MLFVSSSVLADDFTWIKQQIQQIKPPRHGVANSEIDLLKDPFIFLKKNKIKKDKKNTKTSSLAQEEKKKQVIIEPTFKLKAIINKTALINGRWYNLGDNVHGYKLVKITATDVVLKKRSKRKHLTILTKNKFIDHRKKK